MGNRGGAESGALSDLAPEDSAFCARSIFRQGIRLPAISELLEVPVANPYALVAKSTEVGHGNDDPAFRASFHKICAGCRSGDRGGISETCRRRARRKSRTSLRRTRRPGEWRVIPHKGALIAELALLFVGFPILFRLLPVKLSPLREPRVNSDQRFWEARYGRHDACRGPCGRLKRSGAALTRVCARCSSRNSVSFRPSRSGSEPADGLSAPGLIPKRSTAQPSNPLLPTA